VLRGAKPEDILGALTGVSLGPATCRAILTGCVVPEPQAIDARQHGNGGASSRSVRRHHAVFSRQYVRAVRGVLALRAAGVRLAIEYPSGAANSRNRCAFSHRAEFGVDLTAALSQIETEQDARGRRLP